MQNTICEIYKLSCRKFINKLNLGAVVVAFQPELDGTYSNSSGLIVGKTVDGRGYAWKRLQEQGKRSLKRNEAYDAGQSVLRNQVKATTIAAFELLTVVIGERADDARTDRVDDCFDLTDAVRLRKDCVACGTPVERIACDIQFWPSSSEYTAAYAATSLELLVRGVNDGFH